MDLKKITNKIESIKKQKIIDKCLTGSFFSICPLFEIHGTKYFKNKPILMKIHCVYFSNLEKEEIEWLKEITTEAANYKPRFYDIFR